MVANIDHTEEILTAKIAFSHETCHAAKRGNLHYDYIVVVTCYSALANPVVWVYFNDERWLNKHNRLLLAAALLRKQNRAWRLPRVNGWWFEIHYNNRAQILFSDISLE